MKRKIVALVCVLCMGIGLISVPAATAANNTEVATIMTIPYGGADNELGAIPEQAGIIGEYSKSFIMDNNTCYILDQVKKRIAIYNEKGVYLNSIPLDFCNSPRDILLEKGEFYVLDINTLSSPVVYRIDSQGSVLAEYALPDTLKHFEVKGLSVTKSGNVCITNDRYAEYELNNNTNTAVKTSNGRTSPYRDKVWKLQMMNDKKMHLRSLDGTVDNVLDINAVSAGAEIVGTDNAGNTYIVVGDMADTSLVIVELTLRKFDKNGNQVGVVRLPLEQSIFYPKKAIDVKGNGDVYYMSVESDGVKIDKLSFGKSYKSNILEKQARQRAIEDKNSKNNTNLVSAAWNTRDTTITRADNMAYLSWTYSSYNNVNPNPTNIKKPTWLSSYGTKTGIPYCWGGFDGTDKSSAPSSWTNFIDAMNKKKFAGNINTSTSGYQSGTAGLDCSGYVGAAVGYSTKPSTTKIYNDTHAHTASERQMMDVYVKSGSHVLFFFVVKYDQTGISSYEANVTNPEKAKYWEWTWANLSGYSLRSYW